MDAVLHALADRHRRKLIEALRDGEMTAGDLADLLPVVRPGVSRHLRVLREAGLVEVRAQGQHRIYRLTPEPMRTVSSWLTTYESLWQNRLDALHDELDTEQESAR